jgi:hypothetical protein
MARERFGRNRYQPDGLWVQTSQLFEIAGVSYRLKEARAWASAAKRAEVNGDRYGVKLELEPGNPHDPNATRVIGVASRRILLGRMTEKEWHLGYVPRELAAEVHRDLIDSNIELAAELYDIQTNEVEGHSYIDIRVFILAPPGHGLNARIANEALRQGDPHALAKQAKDAGDLGLLEERLADWCGKEVKKSVDGVAPHPFMELAKLFRKQKRHGEEVELQEYWDTLPKSQGREVEQLQARLAKFRRQR